MKSSWPAICEVTILNWCHLYLSRILNIAAVWCSSDGASCSCRLLWDARCKQKRKLKQQNSHNYILYEYSRDWSLCVYCYDSWNCKSKLLYQEKYSPRERNQLAKLNIIHTISSICDVTRGEFSQCKNRIYLHADIVCATMSEQLKNTNAYRIVLFYFRHYSPFRGRSYRHSMRSQGFLGNQPTEENIEHWPCYVRIARSSKDIRSPRHSQRGNLYRVHLRSLKHNNDSL